MDELLSVENLNLGFNTDSGFFQALFDVNFKLYKGKMLSIVGESGCGKTMSAMSILGLLPKNARITEGRIIYNGEDLLKKSQSELTKIRGGRIALIPQDPMTSLNPLYTVGNQLYEILETHQNLTGDEAQKKAIEAFEAVQIPGAKSRLNSYPHEFSGGMKQRAIIAMALCCNAEIIIADEPTTALDVTIQAQIMQILSEIKKSFGTSILLITHDLALVSENTDDVAVMYGGRIVESAANDEFFKNPIHPYSKALLNSIPSSKQSELQTITGQPPAITQIIPGCRFNPRCTEVTDICRNELPKFEEQTQSHFCACFNSFKNN